MHAFQKQGNFYREHMVHCLINRPHRPMQNHPKIIQNNSIFFRNLLKKINIFREEVYGRWKQLLTSDEATMHMHSRLSDLIDVRSPPFLPPLIHYLG